MSRPDPRGERFERVVERMEELEVDALFLSHGADLPWLTGYRAMPLERLTLLVLRARGEPLLLVPELEAPRVPDGHNLFATHPWKDTQDPIALTLEVLGNSSTGKIAVSDRMWASSLLALQKAIPDATWTAASSVMSRLRAVKDNEEIEVLREAASAADRVASALQYGQISLIGRTEAEVSDEIGRRLIEEGHQSVNFAIVGSGPNGASPHHEAGTRRIGPGEVVVCDFGGTMAIPGLAAGVGYCSDITRTVVTGEPDTEIREIYEVLVSAQRAGVESARARTSAEDVDGAARSLIERAGLGDRFIHRTGHGIGIEEHEDPYLVGGNATPLEIGNAFSVEPGI
ncbi:MAG TPA: Xaa-Pro peptidase family protein, partial [Acidimicrobiales bacterium]|nr:Xaa-Pro peptidase family protein [Acidimicrobiales bacterium]